jgi:hypothetical protein
MSGKITFLRLPTKDWEKEGTRHYVVYLDDQEIGQVSRERCTHHKKHRRIRYGVTASWQWRVRGRSRMEYDTRKDAAAALVELHEQREQTGN